MKLFIYKTLCKTANLLLLQVQKLQQTINKQKYLFTFNGRKDDIYIASTMESGATWLQIIIHRLISNKSLDFQQLDDITHTFEDAIEKKKNLDPLPAPRIIKTYFSYKEIPPAFGGKFIYLMRDGKDVAVSLFTNYSRVIYYLAFETFFYRFFLKKNKNRWFDHMASWLANKKKYDILYIGYEDLVHNLEKCVREIIAFYHLKVEESEIPAILAECSLLSIAAHADKLEPKDSLKEGMVKYIGLVKGEVDRHFNQQLNQKYANMYKRYLARFNLEDYEPAMSGKNRNGLQNIHRGKKEK